MEKSRGDGHKLKNRMFLLSIRKHFFTVRVTEHWHRKTFKIIKSNHSDQKYRMCGGIQPRISVLLITQVSLELN